MSGWTFIIVYHGLHKIDLEGGPLHITYSKLNLYILASCILVYLFQLVMKFI